MIPPLRANKRRWRSGRDDSENKFKRARYIVRLGFRQRTRASRLLFAFHSHPDFC
jgi:hypothetical protein